MVSLFGKRTGFFLQRSVVPQIRISPGWPPPKIAPEKLVRHSRENIDNTPRPRSWPMGDVTIGQKIDFARSLEWRLAPR